MSLAIFDAPTMTPFESLIGDTVSDTGTYTAILGPPQSLKVIDLFASAEALENLNFLCPSVVRNDQENVLPDRLGCRVAKEPLRRPVPRGDDAIQCFADDGIVG